MDYWTSFDQNQWSGVWRTMARSSPVPRR